MEAIFFPDKKKRNRGLKLFSYGLVAIVFVIIGILIATNLDLPSQSVAEVRPGYTDAGGYPVTKNDMGDWESPFVQVVENVQNAVVNISARSEDAGLPWWYQGVRYSTSSGSGFFFREDGYIAPVDARLRKHAYVGPVDARFREDAYIGIIYPGLA